MKLGQIVYHRIKGYRAELLQIGRLHCVVRYTGGGRGIWPRGDVSMRAPWSGSGSLDYLHRKRGYSRRRAVPGPATPLVGRRADVADVPRYGGRLDRVRKVRAGI